jgi:hypothetical protein
MSNYGKPGNEGVAQESTDRAAVRPYWRRAHRSWWFWLGFVLMLLAITIYVLSDNLALLPHGPPLGGRKGTL